MIKLNGEERDSTGISLEDLFANEGYNRARIVVEINSCAVPGDDYAATILEDGDEVEMFHFHGGGGLKAKRITSFSYLPCCLTNSRLSL